MLSVDTLLAYVEANPQYVSKRYSPCGKYYSIKYTKKAFHSLSEFPKELLECRGAVFLVDSNKLVTLPFTKIFNFGVETQAPSIGLDEVVFASRKVNGFMVAMSYCEDTDELVVSTTGSVASQHVDYAKEEMLKIASMDTWKYRLEAFKGSTLLFECVHKEDPHIIEEPEYGLYYLGMRMNDVSIPFNAYSQLSGKDYTFITQVLGVYGVYTFKILMSEMLDFCVKYAVHEGFVVYTEDGRVAKLKSPFYNTLKYIARAGSKATKQRACLLAKECDALIDLIDYVFSEDAVDFKDLTTDVDRVGYMTARLFAGMKEESEVL